MKENNLIVCDPDIRYANRLAENICAREEIAVKVFVCSSPQKSESLMRQRPIHILVVDETFTREQRCRMGAKKVFVLTKNKVRDLGDEECELYKYQSAGEIIRKIFETYLEGSPENLMRPIRKESTRLVAVYSPIHRAGRTRFAIALGKEYAQREKVLYLNLEEYAGLPQQNEDEPDLGDMIYYIRQGNGNMGIRLASAVKKMDKLEYLPPIPFVTDLKEVSFEEWEQLIEQMKEESLYQRIILDLGESVQGLYRILQLCDRVYMPVLEDEISQRKLEQYERTLNELQLEELAKKTHSFVLTQDVEAYAKVRAKEEY